MDFSAFNSFKVRGNVIQQQRTFGRSAIEDMFVIVLKTITVVNLFRIVDLNTKHNF